MKPSEIRGALSPRAIDTAFAEGVKDDVDEVLNQDKWNQVKASGPGNLSSPGTELVKRATGAARAELERKERQWETTRLALEEEILSLSFDLETVKQSESQLLEETDAVLKRYEHYRQRFEQEQEKSVQLEKKNAQQTRLYEDSCRDLDKERALSRQLEEELQATLGHLKAYQTRADEIWSDMSEKEAQLRDYAAQCLSLTNIRNKLEADREKPAQAVMRLEEQKKDLEDRIKGMNQEIEILQNLLLREKSEIQNLVKTLDEKEGTLTELRRDYERCKQRIETLQQDLIKKDDEARSARGAVTFMTLQLKKATADYEKLEKSYNDDKAKWKSYEQNYERLKHSENELKFKYKNTNEQLTVAETHLERTQKARQNLSIEATHQQTLMEQMRRENQTYRESLSHARNELEVAMTQIRTLEDLVGKHRLDLERKQQDMEHSEKEMQNRAKMLEQVLQEERTVRKQMVQAAESLETDRKKLQAKVRRLDGDRQALAQETEFHDHDNLRLSVRLEVSESRSDQLQSKLDAYYEEASQMRLEIREAHVLLQGERREKIAAIKSVEAREAELLKQTNAQREQWRMTAEDMVSFAVFNPLLEQAERQLQSNIQDLTANRASLKVAQREAGEKADEIIELKEKIVRLEGAEVRELKDRIHELEDDLGAQMKLFENVRVEIDRRNMINEDKWDYTAASEGVEASWIPRRDRSSSSSGRSSSSSSDSSDGDESGSEDASSSGADGGGGDGHGDDGEGDEDRKRGEGEDSSEEREESGDEGAFTSLDKAPRSPASGAAAASGGASPSPKSIKAESTKKSAKASGKFSQKSESAKSKRDKAATVITGTEKDKDKDKKKKDKDKKDKKKKKRDTDANTEMKSSPEMKSLRGVKEDVEADEDAEEGEDRHYAVSEWRRMVHKQTDTIDLYPGVDKQCQTDLSTTFLEHKQKLMSTSTAKDLTAPTARDGNRMSVAVGMGKGIDLAANLVGLPANITPKSTLGTLGLAKAPDPKAFGTTPIIEEDVDQGRNFDKGRRKSLKNLRKLKTQENTVEDSEGEGASLPSMPPPPSTAPRMSVMGEHLKFTHKGLPTGGKFKMANILKKHNTAIKGIAGDKKDGGKR